MVKKLENLLLENAEQHELVKGKKHYQVVKPILKRYDVEQQQEELKKEIGHGKGSSLL